MGNARLMWCLVWCFVAALAVFSVGGGRTALAGACVTKTCTCDDDCSGLVCSADGHCCGPPVTGTPCQKKDAGTGSAGTGGGDAATPPANSGGGCRLAETGSASAGAAVAVSLLLLGARRRSKRKR